jgi:hypothetical protein
MWLVLSLGVVHCRLEDAAVGFILREMLTKTGELQGHSPETCYLNDRRWSGEG